MSALQKKSLTRVLLLLFSVLCLLSCEFSTNEVYERDVNKDVQPPEISVIKLNLGQDTVFVFGGSNNMCVTFCFSSSNQKIKAVRFLIDDVEMKTEYSESGYFEYDQDNLNEGIHKLDIQIYTGSGTGSIADILGGELYVFYNSWTVVVDKSYDLPLSSTIVNGLLQFSWKRYPGYDFAEYVIYRVSSSNTRTEVGRTTSRFFTDNTYVGESGTYEVEVRQQYNGTLPWGHLYLEKDIPSISLTESENGTYIIKWNQSKYFNAVDSCELYIRYNTYSNYVKVKSAESQSDYFYYLTDAKFNDVIGARIVLIQNENVLLSLDYYKNYASSERNMRVGNLFNSSGYPVTDFFQTGQDEFCFSADFSHLNRFSVDRKEEIEKITPGGCSQSRFANFSSSASGRYLTSYNLCENEVMLINTGNLSDKTSASLKQFSGQYYVPQIPVSDIKTVIVNSINQGFYIYDFKTSSSLAYYRGSGSLCKGLKISSAGNYIFLSDDSLRLVKFENSVFDVVWSHYKDDNSIKFYDFHGLNPDQLIIWDGVSFSVRQCSDFSMIIEFQLTDTEILSIDYYNNRMLTFSDGHLFVRSLTDGSLIKDVPVNFDAVDYYTRCILVKNAIVCRSGYFYYFE